MSIPIETVLVLIFFYFFILIHEIWGAVCVECNLVYSVSCVYQLLLLLYYC